MGRLEIVGEVEFIRTGNAPEFFASGLHDVEVMGPVSRFTTYVTRRSAGGVLYREACFTVVLPNDAVGPAIALTLKKGGASFIIPSIADAARCIARGMVN